MLNNREPKPQCPLLVLSPRARSMEQVNDYKPFGEKLLVAMLRDVAAAISRQAIRRYDAHTVFTRFLFGRLVCDPPLIEELRAVPSSLVDCQIERDEDVAAVNAAHAALAHVVSNAPTGAKSVVLLCGHGCAVDLGVAADRAPNDDILFAYLWVDLAGSAFRRVGEAMARWWNA